MNKIYGYIAFIIVLVVAFFMYGHKQYNIGVNDERVRFQKYKLSVQKNASLLMQQNVDQRKEFDKKQSESDDKYMKEYFDVQQNYDSWVDSINDKPVGVLNGTGKTSASTKVQCSTNTGMGDEKKRAERVKDAKRAIAKAGKYADESIIQLNACQAYVRNLQETYK